MFMCQRINLDRYSTEEKLRLLKGGFATRLLHSQLLSVQAGVSLILRPSAAFHDRCYPRGVTTVASVITTSNGSGLF